VQPYLRSARQRQGLQQASLLARSDGRAPAICDVVCGHGRRAGGCLLPPSADPCNVGIFVVECPHVKYTQRVRRR